MPPAANRTPSGGLLLTLLLMTQLLLLSQTQAQVVFPDVNQPSESEPAPPPAAGGSAPLEVSERGNPPSASTSILFPDDPPYNLPQVACKTYDGQDGSCRLLVQCATFYAEIAQLSRSPCTITSTQSGVCCPPTKGPTKDAGVIISFRPTPPSVSVPNLGMKEINFACQKGLDKISERDIIENELLEKNIVAPKGSQAYLHAKLFQTRPDVVDKAKKANVNVQATKQMMQEFKLSKEQGEFALPNFSVQNTIIANTCPEEPRCPDTRYRTIDGRCNNRKNKDWGRAGTAFERVLPPDYSDGITGPRKASDGGDLPSARAISSQVIVDRDSLYDNFTLLIMQWGQFLDHDITHTPITKGKNMSDITCCLNGVERQGRDFHPECLPIKIPENDNFFRHHGQLCMEFVRSFPAVRPKCNFGPREQMNQITAFIDASNVYGSTEDEVRELRTFKNGLLKTGVKRLLPPHREECVKEDERDKVCFKAGDSRVNEQPNLAVLHITWMRQHNRLAKKLQKLNPHWTDEIVFQETRRIVAAQMQHITYNEYLPIVLGRDFMEEFGLVPQKSGYAPGYNEKVNPSIHNAFATAAFRYGHTLVSGFNKAYNRFGMVDDSLRLSKTQFKPYMLYQQGMYDSLLRGLSIQPSQKFDHFFSKEITNHLFAGPNAFGMDLVALNLQRGRDHGIPAYNEWRKICGLNRAVEWAQLDGVMDKEVRQRLQGLYRSIDDIDLFIGGIAERPLRGSLLGPTFLCIIGDQFARLRLGDRFYYENGNLESSFTENQLAEIRKTSLARVMCDNSDELRTIQPLVFIQGHLANKRAGCKADVRIPTMSLDPWKNEGVVWV